MSMLEVLSLVNDISDFFVNQLIVFEYGKKISSTFCAINNETAINKTSF